MPTATLTFTFPEDREAHLYAINGSEFYAALWDVNEHIRRLQKHGGIDKMTAEQLAEEIRNMIANPLSLIES
jgi:hypothetical protein